MLICGLAHRSRYYSVRPTAKVDFANASPGDSYEVPFIQHELIFDNGECMYNAMGLTVYRENMQQQVSSDCNDWILIAMRPIAQACTANVPTSLPKPSLQLFTEMSTIDGTLSVTQHWSWPMGSCFLQVAVYLTMSVAIFLKLRYI